MAVASHCMPKTIYIVTSSYPTTVQNSLSSNSNVMCGLLYHPPSAKASLLAEVESALEQMSPSRLKSLVLLGGFNIDHSPTSHYPFNLSSTPSRINLA